MGRRSNLWGISFGIVDSSKHKVDFDLKNLCLWNLEKKEAVSKFYFETASIK